MNRSVLAILMLGAGAVSAAGPSLDDRKRDAQAAADGPSCRGLNFYWEIGNAAGEKRSGNGPGGSGGNQVRADDPMLIASGGKWLYSAYVVEMRNGTPSSSDIPYLNFKSGYHSLRSCTFPLTPAADRTVYKCGEPGNNPKTDADAPEPLPEGGTVPGSFYYDSGHFEAHAANDPSLLLATQTAPALGGVIGGKLGMADLSYAGLVFAGDARTTAASYGGFLQKVLKGRADQAGGLKIGQLLGTNDVCTSTATRMEGLKRVPVDCNLKDDRSDRSESVPPLPARLDDTGVLPDGSVSVPNGPPWRYSLGHFVEKDQTVSSPGLLGFYPWIDASRQWYGVLARYQPVGLSYQDSVVCGRAIRNAWLHARSTSP